MSTLVEQQVNIKPNKAEKDFLTLAYNSFYDLCDKCLDDKRKLPAKERFSLFVRAFSVFIECLKYEPLQYYMKYVEKHQPPGDIISFRYFEIIRHILIHFPIFERWSQVKFNRDLILWCGGHSKIDKFLCDMEGRESFKWRIWEPKNKKMSYGYTINFPKKYKDGSNIYLKDLIDEKLGIEVCFRMMKGALDSQVESVNSIPER